MLNADGTLLSKEIYKYEFDFLGNWNKMTTSVAVVDSRGITFEPTEVTYRSIMYYLDENMVKMVTPGAATTPQPVAPAANTTSNPPAPNPPAAKPPTANPPPPTPIKSCRVERATESRLLPSRFHYRRLQPRRPNSRLVQLTLKFRLSVPTQKFRSYTIDEPPPSPGPKPILKPVSGGVLNGTAINLPPPLLSGSRKANENLGYGFGRCDSR